MKISVDMDKARQIGHDMRRRARAEAFAPLDEAIAKMLPGRDLVEVEAERQKIRDRDADIHRLISAASTPEEILRILASR